MTSTVTHWPFVEARKPRSFESGDMDEYVLSASITGNEAEALLDVEPFHHAGLFDGCTRI